MDPEDIRHEAKVAIDELGQTLGSAGRAEASINTLEYLRTLFSVFSFRVCLIPASVQTGVSLRRVKGGFLAWNFREAYIFGFRVARTIVGKAIWIPD